MTGSYDWVTTIQVDDQGYLWAAVLGKGIFRLEAENWKMMIPLTGNL